MQCAKTFYKEISSARAAARGFFALFSTLLINLFASTAFATTIHVIHPGPETELDMRNKYDWIVLRAALEKTRRTEGDFVLSENTEFINAARGLYEMSLPAGRINVLAKVSSIELEKKLLPIRIPFDLGIRGYRILLIRKDNAVRFATVNNVNDLTKFSFGQGDTWADVDVLKAAGLTVEKSGLYRSLFPMLSKGRFDAFPRAIDEAYAEMDARQGALPDLMVEPHLLLYYPMPRYFFVRRDAEGEQLAKRIEAGLEAMIADGSLRVLFEKHKGELIRRSKLMSRQLLTIPNPFLPSETPLSRKELWYTPFTKK